MGRRISSSTNIFPKLAVYTSSLVILLCRPTISSDELIDKTPLFVFGDSLFDSGMTLYNGVEGAGAEFWPYGFTFFKKPAGRYSDGRVIPDFIGTSCFIICYFFHILLMIDPITYYKCKLFSQLNYRVYRFSSGHICYRDLMIIRWESVLLLLVLVFSLKLAPAR